MTILRQLQFETKNRNEKNLPCMDECKQYLNKLDLLKNQWKNQLLFMAYISVPMVFLKMLKSG
jgi:hypothetical protein